MPTGGKLYVRIYDYDRKITLIKCIRVDKNLTMRENIKKLIHQLKQLPYFNEDYT